MSYNSKSKVKVLYLLKILREETNAEHGLSMPQIIQRLAEHGVSAERKSIYTDLDALREFGVDVRTYRTSPVEYGVAPDEFSLEELMVMVDAVQPCRAITQRQADSLVRSIKRLTNKEDREVSTAASTWRDESSQRVTASFRPSTRSTTRSEASRR